MVKKVVFVLDHSCAMKANSGVHCTIEAPSKGKSAKAEKSLWTCHLEAVLEYCRLIFDLFEDQKLIHFVCASSQPVVIGQSGAISWSSAPKSCAEVLAQLASFSHSLPGETGELDLARSVKLAVQLLAQRTLKEAADDVSWTSGEIVLLTSLPNSSMYDSMRLLLRDAAASPSPVTANRSAPLRLSSLRATLIHCHPCGRSPAFTAEADSRVDDIVSTELMVTAAGRAEVTSLVSLAMRQHELFMTTVSGIPMKEETGTGQSTNYDVELVHHAGVFAPISTLSDLITTVVKDGHTFKTIQLRWTTPRSSATEFHPTCSSEPVSPLAVNSKPTQCLTQFVLNGRCVMLELPVKSLNKFFSCSMTAVGGLIFVHLTSLAPSLLDDTPPISEYRGGVVTDYRASEFAKVVTSSRLVPTSHTRAVGRSIDALIRETCYFPLTQQDNFLPAVAVLERLLTHIHDTNLVETQLVQSRDDISLLCRAEANLEPLILTPGSSGKLRELRREDQYAKVMAEVARLLASLASLSPSHRLLHEHLLQLRPQLSSHVPATKRVRLQPQAQASSTQRAAMRQSGESLLSTYQSRRADPVREEFVGRVTPMVLYRALFAGNKTGLQE